MEWYINVNNLHKLDSRGN